MNLDWTSKARQGTAESGSARARPHRPARLQCVNEVRHQLRVGVAGAQVVLQDFSRSGEYGADRAHGYAFLVMALAAGGGMADMTGASATSSPSSFNVRGVIDSGAIGSALSTTSSDTKSAPSW